MRTLIVDDEPLALRRLEILLSRRPRIEIIGTCRNGRDALAMIESMKPDLVLLDIRMPEMTGLEVATALTAPDAPAVIFVTAYDAFAVQAFEAAAVDYLLKPVEPERLDQALARARQQYAMRDAESRAGELEAVVNALRHEGAPEGNDFWVKDRNGTVRLSKHEMDWVEAEGDYVRIHCGERSWLHRETMTAMENMLDERFFVRVHRSAIVNSRRVTRTGTTTSGGRLLHLETGAEIRIGRSYESAVKRALGRVEA
jgi:DNA-binding LytR/AlgR family response regulator